MFSFGTIFELILLYLKSTINLMMKIFTVSFIIGFFIIFGELSAQVSDDLNKNNSDFSGQVNKIHLKNLSIDSKIYNPKSLKTFKTYSTTDNYSQLSDRSFGFHIDSLFLKKVSSDFVSEQEKIYIPEPEKLKDRDESEKPEYNFQPEYNPLTRFGKDLWIQATSPFRMKGNDFLWLGAGAFITAGLLVSDQGSYAYIKNGKGRTDFFNSVSPEITEFGGNYGLISLGAFAGYSIFFNDKKAMETSYLAFESFLTSSIWVVGIKWIAGRQRPSAQEESRSANGGKWYGPVAYVRTNPKKSITNFDAFPSGHTATAFSIATVIAKQYDETLVVPVLSYAAASIVGITRIAESTHWASDVFVGAIIGYLTATQIVHDNPSQYTRDHRTKVNTKSKLKTSFSLGMYENSPALVFKATF